MFFLRTAARQFACSIAVALLLVLAAGPVRAELPLKSYDMTLRQMIDAIQSKSYDKFMADGDTPFKTGFTEAMFEDLARQLGPRLQQGYAMSFLTTLSQRGYVVYVWKIAFKDGKDDFLVTLFTKDGNVSGLVFR